MAFFVEDLIGFAAAIGFLIEGFRRVLPRARVLVSKLMFTNAPTG